MKKVRLQDMSSVEFAEEKKRNPTILIPLGSQELQGPQGPMGDYMLSEKMAEEVARRSDAISAPTIPFGYADVFRSVPGGMQLRPETFLMLLEDCITAFLDHGLARVVLFNGHTGNAPLIDQLTRRLKRERGIIIPAIHIWKITPKSLWEELHPGLGEKAGGHGADPIASVYHHYFPHLMRPELAEPATAKSALGLPTIGLSAVDFDGVPINVPLDATDVHEHGLVGGDARLSNADKGRAFAEHIIEVTANFIRHFEKCDPCEGLLDRIDPIA